VQTVIDLMRQVLRPLAEKRGLTTWAALAEFAGDVWYPSRLPFGKFKGRLYQEAVQDAELRAWLAWLAESTNEKSSLMGRWYLRQGQGIRFDRGGAGREAGVERRGNHSVEAALEEAGAG
jgi:DNA polymerase-3 subunit epsilon